MTNLEDIQSFLNNTLVEVGSKLKSKGQVPGPVEYSGTFEVMQGKKKVDGHYFASVMPKPKDIRLYFIPIYSHPTEFSFLSEEVKKCLKGKSCFHIKKITPQMEGEFKKLIETGAQIYHRDGLI